MKRTLAALLSTTSSPKTTLASQQVSNRMMASSTTNNNIKVKKEDEEEEETSTTNESTTATYSPMRSSDSKQTKIDKFLITYDYIKEMRSKRTAPVDTMGCASGGAEPGTREYRLQTLLSLVLSSQTKDQVTHAAMNRIREHGLSVPNLLSDTATPESKLIELIYPVGFYKRKAQYVKRIMKILHEEYNDDIPDTIEGLVKLPGVGPKMAHLAMSCAWNNTVGIGVDTHVHRISNRLNWVTTKVPEETRIALEKFVPSEHWYELNHMLVGFGQTICKPVSPLCGECKLLSTKLCPYGLKHWNEEKRKSISPKSKSIKKEQTTKKRKITKKRVKRESSDEEDSEDELDNELPIIKVENSVDIEDLYGSNRRVTRSLSKRIKKEE
jgi:endonuclease-3